MHAVIIGEHGDSELAVWSSANISGVDLPDYCRVTGKRATPESLDEIYRSVRDSAYAIIEGKGATYYGIGMAVLTGLVFDCPVVFAKKSKTINLSDDVYSTTVYSFTHQVSKQVLVSKRYLNPGDRVLIVDDFLANGAALEGLCDIVEQAGATVVGAAIAIEKAFQPGGAKLRARGLRIESLARIESMGDDSIVFCQE